MVQYVLKRTFYAGHIAFDLPQDAGAREAIRRELERCRDKNNDYVLLTIQPPKKPRTTGEHSQNHHLNGHIMQICNETGNSYDAIKYCVKMLAVEEMGYPYELVDGHICPQSEADCSTEECAKLIEAAHVWAAHHGIILQE
nr:MAG TPA: Putative HNHc nuclease [Caudoviricetes sp.]